MSALKRWLCFAVSDKRVNFAGNLPIIQMIMNYMFRALPLIAVIFLSLSSLAASKPIVVDLWLDGAPSKSSDPHDTARVYVFLPETRHVTGRAVVICPGGGYSGLAIGHEGMEWADFFNGQGIAAIVLKYRLPHGNRDVPVDDAMETIRLVRRNAKEWHVDPAQVGIMGSSAGGHLASFVATMGKGDAAPNFQILFYPVITMDPGFTHRGSIALSDDDHTVLPANGVNFYFACYRHDVPATLHVYPSGGHGWGIRQSFAYHIEMLLDLKAWLRSF